MAVAAFGLCVFAVYACVHGLAVLTGLAEPSNRLPPPYPGWAGIHFVSSLLFVVIAPVQFWPAIRRRRPRLHRWNGRLAVLAGLTMAASGVAIAHFAQERPVSERIFMTSFFLGYMAILALGWRAALARDFVAHEEWMVRMLAVALTPLMQRVVFVALAGSLGIEGPTQFWELFVSAAWLALVVELMAAECWLRSRDGTQRRASQLAMAAGSP